MGSWPRGTELRKLTSGTITIQDLADGTIKVGVRYSGGFDQRSKAHLALNRLMQTLSRELRQVGETVIAAVDADTDTDRRIILPPGRRVLLPQ